MLKAEYIEASDKNTIVRKIQGAIAKKNLVILIGKCSVFYEGRGASKLGSGDRIVLIKPDGAVLVHRPTGYSPVNWQPDSKIIEVDMNGDNIVVKSIREKPREILEIVFEEPPRLLIIQGLEDKAEFIEYLDEHEIRDYISKNPDIIERGLHVITLEKPVEPGFIDLYARDSEGNIVVIELKRTTGSRDAVLQLYKYVEALRKRQKNVKIRGILVAPSITRNAASLLQTLGLEYKPIDVAKIHKELSKERRKYSKSILEFIRK